MSSSSFQPTAVERLKRRVTWQYTFFNVKKAQASFGIFVCVCWPLRCVASCVFCWKTASHSVDRESFTVLFFFIFSDFTFRIILCLLCAFQMLLTAARRTTMGRRWAFLSSSSSWIRNNVITMCGIMFDSSQLKSNLLEGIVTRYYLDIIIKAWATFQKGERKIEFVIVPCRTDLWVCSNLWCHLLPAPTPHISPLISHVALLILNTDKIGMWDCVLPQSFSEIAGWNFYENRKELPTSDTGGTFHHKLFQHPSLSVSSLSFN